MSDVSRLVKRVAQKKCARPSVHQPATSPTRQRLASARRAYRLPTTICGTAAPPGLLGARIGPPLPWGSSQARRLCKQVLVQSIRGPHHATSCTRWTTRARGRLATKSKTRPLERPVRRGTASGAYRRKQVLERRPCRVPRGASAPAFAWTSLRLAEPATPLVKRSILSVRHVPGAGGPMQVPGPVRGACVPLTARVGGSCLSP